MNLRIGQGFDVHRYVAGRPLILGGVEIPFDRGLDGHSDADALTHALIDSILGALGLPDIGSYFPNNDPKWFGVSSLKMLEAIFNQHVAGKARIINFDITVIAEAPKILPYREAMLRNLTALLHLPLQAGSIKATTAEKLGAIGREDGLAALSVVLLELI